MAAFGKIRTDGELNFANQMAGAVALFAGQPGLQRRRGRVQLLKMQGIGPKVGEANFRLQGTIGKHGDGGRLHDNFALQPGS